MGWIPLALCDVHVEAQFLLSKGCGRGQKGIQDFIPRHEQKKQENRRSIYNICHDHNLLALLNRAGVSQVCDEGACALCGGDSNYERLLWG